MCQKAGYGDYCKKAYVYKGKIEQIFALLDANKSIGCSGSSTSSSTSVEDEATDEEDEAETGQTKFVSIPSGAQVILSGVTKGVTPISLKLTEGQLYLKISKSGYKLYGVFINIGSDGLITSLDLDSEQNGNSTKIEDDEWQFDLEKN